MSTKSCDSSSSSDHTPFISAHSRRPSRRTLLIIMSSVIFGLLVVIAALLTLLTLRRAQPWSSGYDRSQDDGLLGQIRISPEAAALPLKGELFCWALTAEQYHDTRALAVNETWLRRCDHGVFFTNAPFQATLKVPHRTVFAGIPDAYENLFYKSRYAFRYIAREMRADFDWFVKADDDTYIIVENLRRYLRTLDANEPYYLGFRLKPHLENGYNGGGAGYVLSRKALELFDRHAYDNATLCPDDPYEDVGIGRCLANLGILPHKTVNELGQQRFNTFHPDETTQHRLIDEQTWLVDLPMIRGYGGIARDLISFHHLSPTEIRLFEILLYRVTVEGDCKERIEL